MNYFKSASNCRILIAEDDVAQQMLFAEVLEREGFAIMVTVTANEVLRTLRAAGHVDLLIADIRLEAAVNGFELAVQARHLQPQLKTLFMTGSLKEMVYSQTAADREAEMMLKPFKLADFVKRVFSLIDDSPCAKVQAV